MSSCICGLGKWSRPRSTKSNKIALGAIPKIVAETKNESASAKNRGKTDGGKSAQNLQKNAATAKLDENPDTEEAQPVHPRTNNQQQACVCRQFRADKSPFVKARNDSDTGDRVRRSAKPNANTSSPSRIWNCTVVKANAN